MATKSRNGKCMGFWIRKVFPASIAYILKESWLGSFNFLISPVDCYRLALGLARHTNERKSRSSPAPCVAPWRSSVLCNSIPSSIMHSHIETGWSMSLQCGPVYWKLDLCLTWCGWPFFAWNLNFFIQLDGHTVSLKLFPNTWIHPFSSASGLPNCEKPWLFFSVSCILKLRHIFSSCFPAISLGGEPEGHRLPVFRALPVPLPTQLSTRLHWLTQEIFVVGYLHLFFGSRFLPVIGFY